MIDARVQEWRGLVRQGELPLDLMEELRSVVGRLVRRRLLPPAFAPYGQWDDEAAEEIFGAWYADRLLARNDLQALLDRAATVASFRRLAQRSVRQHLLNRQDRSQAGNLFRRTVALLDNDPAFTKVRDAVRPQDRWYAHGPAPVPEWSGAERELVAHAWAVGDFIVIRYRAGAGKLSPVLDADGLRRFVAGLMDRAGRALTAGLIMRALAARFDLGEVRIESFGSDDAPASSVPVDAQVALDETARAICAALTPRQREVLRRSTDDTVAGMAQALDCSVGTVLNEQRRIGELVARLSEDDAERDRLLNIIADLEYSDDDE